MKGWSRTAWTGALLLSLLVHGGAAALLGGREDEIRIAGGDTVEIAVLGNSFEDAMSGGEFPEVIEVEASAADRVTEVIADMAETVQASAADAVQPESRASAPPEVPLAAETSASEAEGVVAVPSVERQQPEKPEPPEDAARPEAVGAHDAETVEAIVPEKRVNPVADAPIPMPRPDIEALKAEEELRDAERREQARRQHVARQPEAPRPQEPRSAAGAGGASQADARRGDAAGASEGRLVQSSGQGSQTSAAGNAAVSNYPGEILSRLRRSLGFPAQARRQRITGEVQVAFTIASNGAVSGVRVVRSSGHAILDEAALQAVHRAAPFPHIPKAAGRSNWDFTVPLAFTR